MFARTSGVDLHSWFSTANTWFLLKIFCFQFYIFIPYMPIKLKFFGAEKTLFKILSQKDRKSGLLAKFQVGALTT